MAGRKSALAALMSASSPDDVKRFFGIVFRHRSDYSSVDVDALAAKFSVTGEVVVQVSQQTRRQRPQPNAID